MGAPRGSSEEEKAKNTNADIKRAFLAASTLGLSEIKTGGGEYGDETVADSLFPKTINDLMSDDRTAARKATDAAKNAMVAPSRAPDLADKLLAGAGAPGKKLGRKSTFISGAWGTK